MPLALMEKIERERTERTSQEPATSTRQVERPQCSLQCSLCLGYWGYSSSSLFFPILAEFSMTTMTYFYVHEENKTTTHYEN